MRAIASLAVLILGIGGILLGLAIMGIGVLAITGSAMQGFAPPEARIDTLPLGIAMFVVGLLIAALGVAAVFYEPRIGRPRPPSG